MTHFSCGQDWLFPGLDVSPTLQQARWIPRPGGGTSAVSVPTHARTKKTKKEICVRERGGAVALTHSPIPVFAKVEHCSVRQSSDRGSDGVDPPSRLMLHIVLSGVATPAFRALPQTWCIGLPLGKTADTATRATGRRSDRKGALGRVRTARALEQATFPGLVYEQRGMNAILSPLVVLTD